MKFINNIFDRLRQLWYLPGSLEIATFEINLANAQNVDALREEIAALTKELKSHIAAEAGQTHKRLTAAIQSASHETLYEAQLVRHLVCGTCQKKYGARVRWTENGTLICPECAAKQGLD